MTSQNEIRIREIMACCPSLNWLSAALYGSTDRFDLWFRVTVCLRKIGGDWLTTHEHSSTPFHMDGTFGAALDLQP